eukprot:CAMPEP_0183380802 /NCGR_PEP_ID=MMETSP0164_2-20130417/126118_1 /TAXON_ID=221442 /ORGANISM="Coccolithus pelagicus ssp braarudi, Strain PLY182g" /LENGTH=351 /DNA_ID=CAMNT_0025558403 /DNA_START=352 /DNA_END=1408 /DNA_ORIENTATION=-
MASASSGYGGPASPLSAEPPVSLHVRFTTKRQRMQAVYESLYAQHGYHSQTNFSHSGAILSRLISLNATWNKGVLDVGCSHGLGIERLWRAGITAVGVDIAPTAVALADRVRSKNRRCGAYRCFQPSNGTKLPFPSKTFDAIVSTDMLEHILAPDVPAVADEFCRVAESYMFLKIATKTEVFVQPAAALQLANLTSLHTTVMPLERWADVFRRCGHVSVIRHLHMLFVRVGVRLGETTHAAWLEGMPHEMSMSELSARSTPKSLERHIHARGLGYRSTRPTALAGAGQRKWSMTNALAAAGIPHFWRIASRGVPTEKKGTIQAKYGSPYMWRSFLAPRTRRGAGHWNALGI